MHAIHSSLGIFTHGLWIRRNEWIVSHACAVKKNTPRSGLFPMMVFTFGIMEKSLHYLINRVSTWIRICMQRPRCHGKKINKRNLFHHSVLLKRQRLCNRSLQKLVSTSGCSLRIIQHWHEMCVIESPPLAQQTGSLLEVWSSAFSRWSSWTTALSKSIRSLH